MLKKTLILKLIFGMPFCLHFHFLSWGGGPDVWLAPLCQLPHLFGIKPFYVNSSQGFDGIIFLGVLHYLPFSAGL